MGNSTFVSTRFSCLVVGLDAAGKTSILYALQVSDSIETSVPTIGFSVESFESTTRLFDVISWDIGGGSKIKPLWRHYYSHVNAVVFVIDASNPERMGEPFGEDSNSFACGEFKSLFSNPADLVGLPLLILANFSDRPHLSVDEVAMRLDLPKCSDRLWRDQESSVNTQTMTIEGAVAGFEWLFSCVNSGRPAMLSYLLLPHLAHCKPLPFIDSTSCSTPLCRAARDGDMDQMMTLLTHSAVDAVDEFSNTALMYAIQAQHKIMVDALLSHGANVSLQIEPRWFAESVPQMMGTVNRKSRGGQPSLPTTPLQMALSRGVDPIIVSMLLKAGAPLTAAPRFPPYIETAMCSAFQQMRYGHFSLETVRLLFECADQRGMFLDGLNSSLLLASMLNYSSHNIDQTTSSQQSDILNLLLEHGADISARRFNPSDQSCSSVLEVMLRNSSCFTGFNKDDLAGVARLRLLAEAGAPIDIKVWTLLHQWFGHRGELYHMIRDMLIMECKHRLIQYTSDWMRLRHI